MSTDKEIIEAMNIIKTHCKGRHCPTCACWSDKNNFCIVSDNVEPGDWKTEEAIEMD